MKLRSLDDKTEGIVSAAGAYFLWGILPVYWKFVGMVPAHEVLAHRIVWSFIFMLLLLLVTRKFTACLADLKEILAQPKKAIGVVMASALISINWVTYIWAVNNDRVIETSLGYYINPLVSVLLGVIVLREKVSFWQAVAFCLAFIGVLNMTLHFGVFPWLALLLAGSFGLYGLFKKMVNPGAITGLTLETMVVVPFALGYLGFLTREGASAFSFAQPNVAALLMGAGIVTAVPLLLFASGAKRLPLATIGFLQYIAPTIALILGIFLYHETFTMVHLTSFIFIWLALTIFSLGKTKYFLQFEMFVFHKLHLKEKSST
ncbi:EamA family transporter RarD [Desulforamulus aquiferis]|uniref:EamA family transporter RarD n=1 Tax=Desulforamulus aquiferis TaxID=1397668 RepID=A0AAW7ZAQ2_9FIRM|nr:EamA family transporter RarD [Desulforamulus aquiferis]MDO7786309.1 EamA family transporter RarD [Desulforamulus aquiferis]RYD04993.1 hypothetical protein N752_11555 [Desulforamulus aquiferis]